MIFKHKINEYIDNILNIKDNSLNNINYLKCGIFGFNCGKTSFIQVYLQEKGIQSINIFEMKVDNKYIKDIEFKGKKIKI